MVMLQICQLILTIIEIGMCYTFIDLLVEKKNICKCEYIIRTITILCLAFLLFANRVTTCFMNHFLYLFQGILMAIPVCMMYRSRYFNTLSVTLSYFSGIGLLHILLLFILLLFMKDEKFHQEVYYGFGVMRVLLMAIALVFVTFLKSIIKKKLDEILVLVRRMQIPMFMFGIFGWWTIAWGQMQIVNLGWEWSIWYLGALLFTLCAIGTTCYWIYDGLKKETEISIVHFQDKMRDDYYNDIKVLYENCLCTSHDLKNHILVLKDYAERSDVEKIQNYLKKIGEPFELLNQHIWCENEIVNLIINTKIQEARKKHISVETQIENVLFSIEDNELCSVLANLLDNAVEACEKVSPELRWIRIAITKKSGCSIIKVENSISKQPNVQNGIFISSKVDGHGYGLKSIRSIVDKYDGTMKCNFNKDAFLVIITFI